MLFVCYLDEEYVIMNEVCCVFVCYVDMEDLIWVGVYKFGIDLEVDVVMCFVKVVEIFLF